MAFLNVWLQHRGGDGFGILARVVLYLTVHYYAQDCGWHETYCSLLVRLTLVKMFLVFQRRCQLGEKVMVRDQQTNWQTDNVSYRAVLGQLKICCLTWYHLNMSWLGTQIKNWHDWCQTWHMLNKTSCAWSALMSWFGRQIRGETMILPHAMPLSTSCRSFNCNGKVLYCWSLMMMGQS